MLLRKIFDVPKPRRNRPGPAASCTTRASIATCTGCRVNGEMIPQPIVSFVVSRAISAETTVDERASIWCLRHHGYASASQTVSIPASSIARADASISSSGSIVSCMTPIRNGTSDMSRDPNTPHCPSCPRLAIVCPAKRARRLRRRARASDRHRSQRRGHAARWRIVSVAAAPSRRTPSNAAAPRKASCQRSLRRRVRRRTADRRDDAGPTCAGAVVGADGTMVRAQHRPLEHVRHGIAVAPRITARSNASGVAGRLCASDSDQSAPIVGASAAYAPPATSAAARRHPQRPKIR